MNQIEWSKKTTSWGGDIYKTTFDGLRLTVEDWKGYVPTNSASPIFVRWYIYSPDGNDELGKGQTYNVEAAFAIAFVVAAIAGGTNDTN